MKILLSVQFLCYLFIVLNNVAVNASSRRKGQLVETAEQRNWTGKWFPGNPLDLNKPTKHENVIDRKKCDDGVHGIEIDYSANNKLHNFNYLCISNNLTAFMPNVNTQTVLTEYYIPPAYDPYSVCIDKPLVYDEPIPTYGAFRFLAPKYGEYKYLPPQRWLRSLAEGAVVMLYHPCAESTQREQLKKLVNACLHRHIITPSSKLSSEYPLALLTWGKLLKLSVVDSHLIMNFIKDNAKKAPYSKAQRGTQYYEQDLLQEARLVTNLQDDELCAFDIQEM